ncbi:MAG: ferric reductase-like transmembrane domain-containing protein [Arachnia sp.]
MTATAPMTRHTRRPPALRETLRERYAAQHRRRALARDGLYIAAWLVVAIPLGFWLASGGLQTMTGSGAGLLQGAGILSGLAATSAMIIMLWLSARVGFIDRTIGHDRALEIHKSLGQWTFGGLLLHGGYLIVGYAMADRLSLVDEFVSLWGVGDFVFAVVAIGLLALVAVSSIVSAQRSLGHEVWHAIHLTTYAAILLALPHQFSMGALFSAGPARWSWLGLWAATLFVMLAWRVFLPLFASLEHRVRVASVTWETHDTVSIDLTGRNIAKLGAQAGQFFHWRFLQPGLWWHQHPFSLSMAPQGDHLRVTVRALGKGTHRLATTLKPGTRVMFEGPYGIFSESARTAPDVVLVGFGIGVAPVRALLEETGFEPGHATVIIRASSDAEVAHLKELRAWCQARGAALRVITGHRGRDADGTASWLPARYCHLTLADLAGPLDEADVYLCGPESATTAVVAEAKRAGVAEHRIHHEAFAW